MNLLRSERSGTHWGGVWPCHDSEPVESSNLGEATLTITILSSVAQNSALLAACLVLILCAGRSHAEGAPHRASSFVDHDRCESYVDAFNRCDDELIKNAFPNADAWNWMRQNVPWFECPDSEIEETYYYRWWVYRKHIKQTNHGYVVTEFLPEVKHSGKYNTIACAAGLHIEEGRWLCDREYVEDYIRFWFSEDGEPRKYSMWIAHAVYEYCITVGDFTLAGEYLDALAANYERWEKSNQHHSGLFWSHDDRDGGEYSISGNGLRPTLNSYMYADALAISRIARLFNRPELEKKFRARAENLKSLVQTRLWDQGLAFYTTIPLERRSDEVETFDHSQFPPARRVRELYGYLPWKFQLAGEHHAQAWHQLLDPAGFQAPFGPTTAEQRHPRFMKNRIKRCQWDGSSWPFTTSLTLGALANVLHHCEQDIVTKEDYLDLLRQYSRCQKRTLPYGEQIRWIGESLHPHSGIWLSRAIALDLNIDLVKSRDGVKDKNHALQRGKDYNHSSFCDLVISGLIGLEFKENGGFTVAPLLPEGVWDWFALEDVRYRDQSIAVLWDRTGERYGRGAGMTVMIDGRVVAAADALSPLAVRGAVGKSL